MTDIQGEWVKLVEEQRQYKDDYKEFAKRRDTGQLTGDALKEEDKRFQSWREELAQRALDLNKKQGGRFDQ